MRFGAVLLPIFVPKSLEGVLVTVSGAASVKNGKEGLVLINKVSASLLFYRAINNTNYWNN